MPKIRGTTFRVFLASVAAAALMLSCGNENVTAADPAGPKVNLGKQYLGDGKYGNAERVCMEAERLQPGLAEAQYCVMLANVGKLANAVSDILGIVAAAVAAPPSLRTQASLDVKAITLTLVAEIEDALSGIDEYAYKLTLHDDPTFHLESFPLAVKVDDLMSLTGETGFSVDPNLKLDIGGSWDKTEVLLLGASVNAFSAVLDYVFAHKLKLDEPSFDFSTTGSIAEFLALNPNIIAPDPSDTARIAGDDTRKGLRYDVLAAVSYIVGRDTELARVTPPHTGLPDAIKLSARAARPDAVLVWTDEDADGIPEKLGFPAISDLRDAITGPDGQPLISDSDVDNFLSTETWLAILAFGRNMRDNIENGGKAASITAIVERVVADLRVEYTSTRLLQKPVPDFIAVNPGAFFQKVKLADELIPYYFAYTSSSNKSTVRYDMAIETEAHTSLGPVARRMGYVYREGQNDYSHLVFSANDVYASGLTVYSYTFDGFSVEPALLEADGIGPDAKTPLLWYAALQDPSFGGALAIDAEFQLSDGSGGDFTPPGMAAFNKGLNKLIKYYCIDATDFKLDMFDDDATIYADNKIVDCNYD